VSAEPAETAIPETGAEFFARARPKRRIVRTELILDSDLVDEWNEAQKKLTELRIKDASSPRQANAGGRKRSKAVVAQEKVIEGIEDRITEATAWFTLRQMPGPAYQSLKDTNPPRRDNQRDLMSGYDRDAVADGAVRACLIDPALPDCEKEDCTHDPDQGDECNSFQQLQTVLSPSEWEELRGAATEANGAVKDIPKSRRPSSSPRRLAHGSESPSPSE
jgi:hypothetical protein